MDPYERDEVPMLPINPRKSVDEHDDSKFDNVPLWTRSASVSACMSHMSSAASWRESSFVGQSGPLRIEKPSSVQMSGLLYVRSRPGNFYGAKPDSPRHQNKLQLTNKYSSNDEMVSNNGGVDDNYTDKNEHLLKSGQLGMCNDPYFRTCPSYYNYGLPQRKVRSYDIFDAKFHNALYGDAKGWAKRFCSFLHGYMPGVINPHARIIQKWNKFFVISCLVSIFVDPLFFFVLSALYDSKCIVIDRAMSITMAVFRSSTDVIYLFHILLQFRLAYVAPESRVVGAGVLVDEPSKIAVHYLTGFFLIDFFAALPIPQIIILVVLPKSLGLSGANYAKNLLRVAILVQYIPRLYRFLPLLIGQSPIGFIFESAWANFVINLLTFVLSGHVVGSCWYLFGLQQISTLAGNQEPSYFVGEVLFTMAIVGLGLLLFAMLIGNMQNFLQSLGRRRLEMTLRRRDVEQWMSHRRLPQNLRRKVLEAERYTWAATRGVNEEKLMENLPEDLQREIRRHLFKFVEKVIVGTIIGIYKPSAVRIFTLVDEKEPILDSIYEKLKQRTYIKDSEVLYQGGIIDKMVLIVRGKMESIGEDGIIVPLSEGDVCGEELLTWCLEHSSENRDGKKVRILGQRLQSNRTARCLTNVEAFTLSDRDLEEVTSIFPRILRNPRIQGAIRYESPYWRCFAATRIQVAWRYRKKKLAWRYRKKQLNLRVAVGV